MNFRLIICVLALPLLFSGKKTGVKRGDIAPDIAMKSVTGDTIYHLDSLRGQLVLVDFWASWCGPCRENNPAVVQIYNKYKNATFKEESGFTIFSVSLDRDVRAWKAAIEQDGLEWPYHVSDFREWQSPVLRKYGVTGIPSSFLIDGKGKVILVDPWYSDMDFQLARRKKSK